MPCIYSVDVLLAGFLAQLVGQSFGNTIYASHGRHNPYLVAHSHVTVLSYISLEGSVLLGDIQLVVHRFVGISQRAFEIRLQVVLVHPVTRLQVGDGMSDRITIFNNVLTGRSVVDEHLVSSRSVLVKSDGFSIHFNYVTFFHCFKANHHRVSPVDFQISFFHCLFFIF